MKGELFFPRLMHELLGCILSRLSADVVTSYVDRIYDEPGSIPRRIACDGSRLTASSPPSKLRPTLNLTLALRLDLPHILVQWLFLAFPTCSMDSSQGQPIRLP